MLDSFFIYNIPDYVMTGSYVPSLVILSYIVASFGSYTGLQLASEYKHAEAPRARAVTLAAGAIAFGSAIWSMHYIGMLAHQMDMRLSHDPLLTALSMAIAVGIAFGFFKVCASRRLTARKLVTGALLLGTAICGMHYTGMAAMEMPFVQARYVPAIFFVSALIAVAASGAALWIFFSLQRLNDGKRKHALTVAAALVMGAAICGMHYVGMRATVFAPEGDYCLAPFKPEEVKDDYLAFGVAIVTGTIISICLCLKLFRRSRGFFKGDNEKLTFPLRMMQISLALTAFFYSAIAFEDVFPEQAYAFLHHYTLYFNVAAAAVLPVIWGFTLMGLRRWRVDLLEARAAAEKANAAKSEFLANMSHDLRTPMNGILGLSRLLAEGHMYPEQKELVNSIVNSGETLLLLLNDILDFSKMEAGQLTLDEVPFNLKESLQSIVNLLSPLASRKGLVINYSYCELAPSCVIGDVTRIGQIVTNLVGNALKFTENGAVNLSVVSEPGLQGDSLFTICVDDTGIGIPSDMQQRLFNKFSQGDASITRKFGGSGLGLVICKMLAEKMQGTVTLASEEGRGTVVTVTLRLKPASPKAVKQRQSMTSGSVEVAPMRPAARILVVDDHPVNRLFAVRLLEKMGFKGLVVAENGDDAVRLASENNFDLILMDCQMPVMDGLEATRRIREQERLAHVGHKPIIALTAHAMSGDRENCLQAGMDDYISKPINPQALATALLKWLPKQQEDQPAAAPEETQAKKTHSPAIIVDTEYLDLFTGGDREEERSMADMFVSAGVDTLEVLRRHVRQEATNDDWRKAAHKLKGSAGQIGAGALAKACLVAEVGSGDCNKEVMLDEIERSFSEVQYFFTTRLQ
ncbi:MAG: MHYT domain-containing protein [Alphaproteobacteria bacterium]